MPDATVKLGGKTRVIPTDFIVEEIWTAQVCDINYSSLNTLKEKLISRFQKKKEYLHFTLVKKNWDTIRALNYIRKRIGVSLKRFGIAGMKDKRAVTAQRVSLWNGTTQVLARLRLSDIFLKDFEYADERINLGDAVGNRFTITIRDVPNERREVAEILRHFREIVTHQGVPNFYGPQRLSGNVEVGKAIKDGDLKRATELILRKVQSWLHSEGIEAIPKVFWYEKKMLRHLEKYPNDYAGALRRIPKRIRRLFIHAYQSHVFNEKLREALAQNRAPKTITVEGFTMPKTPELKAYPLERRSHLVARDFRVLGAEKGIVKLRFSLNKGEYASTLLSFLLRTGNTENE